MATSISDKRQIRAKVLEARRAVAPPRREAADQALRAAAAALVRGRQVIAAYAPLIGEPGGPGLPETLASVVDTLLLPVVLADLDLDWARYQGPSTLAATGRLGLSEPTGTRLGLAAIATAQLILVPALAVARDGMRLGRGGGCYDRALARVPAGTPVVALLYDQELVDDLPAAAHDRAVSAVLTPSGYRVIPLTEALG